MICIIFSKDTFSPKEDLINKKEKSWLSYKKAIGIAVSPFVGINSALILTVFPAPLLHVTAVFFSCHNCLPSVLQLDFFCFTTVT
ncbi:hypothetical protein DW083_04805 [Parabacteroides sp. AF48-14]|nr:hypothetical protein DW083_04805 [Parabacteroides sp. AF48-14]